MNVQGKGIAGRDLSAATPDGASPAAQEGHRSVFGTLVLVAAPAALLFAVAAPSRTPAYQLAVADGQVVRLDTETGAVTRCGPLRCTRVLAPERGNPLHNAILEIQARERAHARRVTTPPG